MISILIPSIGEERQECLTRCLKSIWGQKVPCEVLVGAGNRRGPIKTTNRLAEIAAGDFFLVLNDDCILLPGFLESCEAAIKEHPDMALGIPYLGTPGDDHLIRYQWEIPYACFPLLSRGYWAIGGRIFDQDYPFYYVDQDLSFRVIDGFNKVIPIPGACLYHEAAPSAKRGVVDDPASAEGWRLLTTRWHNEQDELRKKLKGVEFPATCSGRCRQ